MNKIVIALFSAALFASASAQTMLHSGALHALGAPTTGNVSVTEVGGKVTVKLSNLKTQPGPGLEVWLYQAAAPAKSAKDAAIVAVKHIKVGELKKFAGNFSFTAPAGTKISDFKSVVLYCAVVKTAFAAGNVK